MVSERTHRYNRRRRAPKARRRKGERVIRTLLDVANERLLGRGLVCRKPGRRAKALVVLCWRFSYSWDRPRKTIAASEAGEVNDSVRAGWRAGQSAVIPFTKRW